MEKKELIGEGLTAEVYAWGQDKVLKLYFEKYDHDWANHEARIGAVLHKAGVPSPEVFDMIEEEGRKGIIFQRIFGKTILQRLETEPWKIFDYAKMTAGLHFRIHKCSAEGLPSQRERFSLMFKRTNGILGERESRIMDYVRSLPDGKSICHGDLHFGNIMVSGDQLTAIDWNSAYSGNPLGDVARTCMIMNSPAVPPGTPDFMAISLRYMKSMLYWTYVTEYVKLARVRLEDIDAWTLPVAAAKLKDRIPGEEKWLFSIIDKRLKRLDS